MLNNKNLHLHKIKINEFKETLLKKEDKKLRYFISDSDVCTFSKFNDSLKIVIYNLDSMESKEEYLDLRSFLEMNKISFCRYINKLIKK